MRIRRFTTFACAAAAALAVVTPAAHAADSYVASGHVCAKGKPAYACMGVSDTTVSAGDTVTFAGHISPKALSNLSDWTKGGNTVCLTRYPAKPAADGSWGSTVLDGACTAVRKDRGFSITVQLNKKGTFGYGLEMGPCQGSAGLCGNGDPLLVGVGSNRGSKYLVVTTS
jgi:plastocyanin